MKRDSIIFTRVDKTMKSEIIKLAQNNKRSLSDYLRLVFQDLIDKKTKV